MMLGSILYGQLYKLEKVALEARIPMAYALTFPTPILLYSAHKNVLDLSPGMQNVSETIKWKPAMHGTN